MQKFWIKRSKNNQTLLSWVVHLRYPKGFHQFWEFYSTLCFIWSPVAIASGKTSEDTSESEEGRWRNWPNMSKTVLYCLVLEHFYLSQVRYNFVSNDGCWTVKRQLPMIHCYFTNSSNYIFCSHQKSQMTYCVLRFSLHTCQADTPKYLIWQRSDHPSKTCWTRSPPAHTTSHWSQIFHFIAIR